MDYGRLSEPIVIRRAKDGDGAALAELCARHGPKVDMSLGDRGGFGIGQRRAVRTARRMMGTGVTGQRGALCGVHGANLIGG